MFTLDNLNNKDVIYILGLIDKSNKLNYTRLYYFDILYNNEIINPFIDRLIDLNRPIYECKYIDWCSCINNYKHTKYERYFDNWVNDYNKYLNNGNKPLDHSGNLSKTYKNRNDYLTIEILYNILNINYLKLIYQDIPISNFNYLNNNIYIYELPKDTKKYIKFSDYIQSLQHDEIKELNEYIMIDKNYKEKVNINIINLNNRQKYFYKQA